MSRIGDTSNQALNDATARSTSQSTATSALSVVGGATKKLKFNEHGLPIGENSIKSSSRLGQLARTHVPICYNSWLRVPPRYKDQFWNSYKKEYPDVKESQRGIFMRKARDAWKKLKRKLRDILVGDDVTKWKEHVPNNIRSEDWEAFCDYESTQVQKDLRKKNKAIKDSSLRKSTHNTGRNGYARVAETWKEENGRPPTRAELWLYTHKRKGGGYAPHDQEFAKKIEMLLKFYKERGDEETLDSGPIYETFGKEKGGGVRCVGSAISRKAMLASAFAREMLKEINTERDGWMEEVKNLKKDMETMNSTLTEFINDFKSGKFGIVGNNVDASLIAPTSFHHAPSTSQCSSQDELISCEIQAHTGEIVGHGRKAKIGAFRSVHCRELRAREVRVILDKIMDPSYLVWGGKQGGTTLADVGVGGIMCWHDDYLPCLGDTNEF